MEFGALNRNFDEFKVLAEKQETRVRYHETRAQNIAMAYLFWQRFVFFGISHISSSLSLNCANWWMVLGLSLSCTSVYFLLFVEAVILLYRAQYVLDMICKKEAEICQQILDAGNPDDRFVFNFHVQELEYHPLTIVQRKVYIGSIVCALLAVTAFELYLLEILGLGILALVMVRGILKLCEVCNRQHAGLVPCA